MDDSSKDPSQQHTILLVEDDSMLSSMYKEKFELEGFRVLIAFDGETGLQKALNETYDLLVLDIMMPKLSGTELLTKLRETEKGRDLPVIVITNLSDKDEEKKIEDLHVFSFFPKDEITPSILVDSAKKALSSGAGDGKY